MKKISHNVIFVDGTICIYCFQGYKEVKDGLILF